MPRPWDMGGGADQAPARQFAEQMIMCTGCEGMMPASERKCARCDTPNPDHVKAERAAVSDTHRRSIEALNSLVAELHPDLLRREGESPAEHAARVRVNAREEVEKLKRRQRMNTAAAPARTPQDIEAEIQRAEARLAACDQAVSAGGDQEAGPEGGASERPADAPPDGGSHTASPPRPGQDQLQPHEVDALVEQLMDRFDRYVERLEAKSGMGVELAQRVAAEKMLRAVLDGSARR